MNFETLKQEALYRHPEIALEYLMPHRIRRKIKAVTLALAVLVLIVYLFWSFVFQLELGFSGDRLLGLALILLAVWMDLFVLDAFYYSYYFSGSVSSARPGQSRLLSYELANMLAQTQAGDLTAGFLRSRIGSILVLRLGLSGADLESFLSGRTQSFSSEMFKVPEETTLIFYAGSLYDQDSALAEWLFSEGVNREDWLGALDWVVRSVKTGRNQERWWGRDRLRGLGQVGTSLSYGQAFELGKYAYRLEAAAGPEESFYYQKELDTLVGILSRGRETNALLIGEQGAGSMDILSELSGRIKADEVPPAISHKQVMVVYTHQLISSAGDKVKFEGALIKLLNQTIAAGNIILVIPDFPAFLASAHNLGSDLPSLIDPFLASAGLQLVAFTDPANFHSEIESNSQLMARLEKVSVKSGGGESLMKVIENQALSLESKHGVFFTFSAIRAIADGAERYFTDRSALDKVQDLTAGVVSQTLSAGQSLITKDDVYRLIETRTGVPVGEATAEEKDRLINLEDLLHQRVVGQDEAVKAISQAIRRSRAGVTTTSRPVGSFLFLGPTGVGKTETAKALAEVFFGDEKKISRLDMSEYSSSDALGRLIGSADGRVGTLSTLVREEPYGIVLLDEFEKVYPAVLDLFLQVFDEGVFADATGQSVNARNLIFIATSNAGSDQIWEAVQADRDLQQEKESIVDGLIKDRIFKPELLNRFDGIILFHPLVGEQLKAVALRKLELLRERLKSRGVDLVINDDLVDHIASRGSDPKFGARPINRAIQEEIEDRVAEKLISGEIQPGGKFELTAADLN